MGGKWVIEGDDGNDGKCFSTEVSARFGEPRLTEILRCLASRHLTPDEVVQDATKPDRGRLFVHADRRNRTLMTVGTPVYTARFVRDSLAARPPPLKSTM